MALVVICQRYAEIADFSILNNKQQNLYSFPAMQVIKTQTSCPMLLNAGITDCRHAIKTVLVFMNFNILVAQCSEVRRVKELGFRRSVVCKEKQGVRTQL